MKKLCSIYTPIMTKFAVTETSDHIKSDINTGKKNSGYIYDRDYST